MTALSTEEKRALMAHVNRDPLLLDVSEDRLQCIKHIGPSSAAVILYRLGRLMASAKKKRRIDS